MRRLLLIGLCTLLAPIWAQAAITIDATSSVASAPPATTTSHSHPIASDANFVGVCVASRDFGLAVGSVSSVTVGGAAATFVGRAQSGNAGVSAELWYIVNPATGSQTVAVTNAATNDRTLTTVISLKGVATSPTTGTPVTAGDAGPSVDVNVDGIGSAVGELGLLCGVGRVNTATVAADAAAVVSTEQIEAAHTDATSMVGYIYTEAGASPTIDMRVDLSTSERWGAVGVSVKPLVATTSRKRGAVFYP
jgi:hypothetical protein